MSHLIKANTTSLAWLEAMEYLQRSGGDCTNLAVEICLPTEEDPGIRQVLDQFVAPRRRFTEPVRTVANTIFPAAWYRPYLGDNAEEHLYEMHRQARALDQRRNKRGTYFGRMVAWPGKDGPVNQLEVVLGKLRRNKSQNRRRGNEYEIGVADVSQDIRIQDPASDSKITQGFPCLSHVSVSIHDGKLHLSALYRNHDFARRAYGNYLGLGRLQQFLATESGYEPGELVCLSTHASLAVSPPKGFGKSAISQLLEDCRHASAASQAGGPAS